MKISNMALKNVKGNLYRYIMYYLSNSFAVTAFFIFANFVFHPEINISSTKAHWVAKIGAANSMKFSQVVIVIFSILFVGYSTSIFLKSRGKEFGLLSLYGMTRKQIKKYVLIENTIISILSIGTGILTGVVFSKLFFMIMEVFLSIKLPFNISFKALGLTIIIFVALFESVSIFMLFQIRSKEIIEQIKASKVPKIVPKFSKPKAILGVILIIIGYVTAWIVQGAFVALAMIPVASIIMLGTYFLFTQFSIAISNKILRNENILYKKTNLVAYSQMIFKLQDTAKVLFLAVLLGTITFTATETIYSFFTEMSRIDTPEDIEIIQKGSSLNDNKSINNVKKILKKHNLKINEFCTVKNIKVKNESEKSDEYTLDEILIMSNSDYNKLAAIQERDQIKVNEGEVVYNYPYIQYDIYGKPDNIKRFPFETVKLNINEEVGEYKVVGEVHKGVMSLFEVGYFDVLILNDNDFAHALDIAKEEDLIIYNGIYLDEWKNSHEASVEIKDMLGEKYNGNYYSKVIPYKEIRNSYGMILFIGFFIAFLFFIASGSIIYFKLFNEIKQDSIEYGILRKIGTTKKEINKIITKQIGIIFFLPFIVSTLHSFFALKSLSNLLMTNLFKNGLVVMMGYLVFQFVYFVIIRAIYINRIRYN